MRKTFFTLIIAVFALIGKTNAQNLVANPGMEEWTSDSAPVGWSLADNITKESTTIHGGSFSAKHTSADVTKKLQQNVNGLLGSTTYTISYYYYDNDTAARTRIWSYWLNGTQTIGNDTAILRPNTYSEDADQWINFSTVLTSPPEATGFRFEVRVYKQDGTFGGAVYYDDFSISGEVTIKPEPTNYPTAFTATSEGLGVHLNWTDAMGGQLPDAYLVYGDPMIVDKNHNREIPPVDGTPIDNNLDLNLGYVAWNVSFGDETVFFNSLEPGYYQFYIFPYTNSGATIDYKTDGNPPNSLVIINNITTLLYEPFDADLGVMTAHSIAGAQVWNHYNFNGEDFARCSGFEGVSNENEDWLVSPQVDFTNMDTVLLSFRTAYNYDGNPLQLLVSTEYDGVSDPTNFTWIDLTSEVVWSAGGWVWAQSGGIPLTEYGNPYLYIAFKYSSTVDASSTWELDDLLIYGLNGVGVEETSENKISIYPNPATAAIRFNLTKNAEVMVTDMMGRKLMANYLLKGNNYLPIDQLTNGMYLLIVKSGKDSISRTCFLKR